jgi:hypothetical protein
MVLGAAALVVTALKPLDVQIGDSVEKVDSVLGRRFEKVDAMKMTDSTRLYDKSSGKFLVCFKAQKVCTIEYLGSFTVEDVLAFLRSATPDDKWIGGIPETTKYGTTRHYQTADGRFLAYAVDGSCIDVHTREVDY